MKVQKIRYKNFKGIEFLEKEINGHGLYLIGPNGSYKSTVMQGIYCALSPEKLPPNPLRTGSKDGFIEVTVGDPGVEYRVYIGFSENNPSGTLNIHYNGEKQKSPATLLKDVIGKITFDPFTDLLNKSAKEQVKFIKDMVGLNFDKLDAQHKEIYDLRTQLNTDIKNLKGSIETREYKEHELEVFKEERDLKELDTQIRNAGNHNQEVSRKQNRLESIKADLERGIRAQKDAADLRLFCERLQEMIEANKSTLETIYAKASESTGDSCMPVVSLRRHLKDVVQDFTDIGEAIEKQNANEANVNEAVAKLENEQKELQEWLNTPANKAVELSELNQKYQDTIHFNKRVGEIRAIVADIQKVTELKTMADGYSSQLEEIAAEKVRMVNEAAMPVEGLGMTEDYLTLNGLPFDETQISKSKIIETGIKILIALNPPLHLCRIKDGSLLDKKTLAALEQFIRDNDYQPVVEFVEQDGEGELKLELSEF